MSEELHKEISRKRTFAIISHPMPGIDSEVELLDTQDFHPASRELSISS